MSRQRYGYLNCLSQIQLPQNRVLAPHEQREIKLRDSFTKTSSSPMNGAYDSKDIFNLNCQERRTTYLEGSSHAKRPRPYCPLSREKSPKDELQLIKLKGAECIGSKEWLEYISSMCRKGVDEQEVLKKMKEARSNYVYLSFSSSKSQNELKNCEIVPKKEGSEKKIEPENQGCTIDQLSKIQEKQTLSLDIKSEDLQNVIVRTSKNEEIKQNKRQNQQIKGREQLILIKEQEEVSSQLQRYRQPKRSPLHNKIISQQKTQFKTSNFYRQDKRPVQPSSFKKSAKKFVNYEQLKYSDEKNTKRNKENVNVQPLIKRDLSKNTVRRVETWNKAETDSHSSSPQKQIDIYKLDFKLTKPDMNKYSNSFTPVKNRYKEMEGRTVRADYSSKQKSQNCSRSVSKGKLTLVTASRHR